MATPAIEAYKARIASFIEGKDPIAVQSETANVLQQLVAGVPENNLYQRPGPDKWSVAELLAHFAEAEIVSTWRYRQMLEHNGSTLTAFDQELWHKLGEYGSRKLQESLQLFRLLREANLRMFSRLNEEEWQRFGVHAERGKMTIVELAKQIAGHDLNHIEQIRKIVQTGS